MTPVFLSWENNRYGLYYLVIGGEDGTLRLQSGYSNGSSLPRPDSQETYEQAIQRGIIHIRRPMLLEDNTVGFMQYGMSFEPMVEASRRMNYESVALIIGGMAIAQGDYSRRAPEKGRDEISQLAVNFNSMAGAIQQHIQKITLLNQDLELRVEARTHDLRELNHTSQETIENLKWAQENLIRSEKNGRLRSLSRRGGS